MLTRLNRDTKTAMLEDLEGRSMRDDLIDYCHEIDHGTSEDRAVFGSDSSEP